MFVFLFLLLFYLAIELVDETCLVALLFAVSNNEFLEDVHNGSVECGRSNRIVSHPLHHSHEHFRRINGIRDLLESMQRLSNWDSRKLERY